MRTSFATRRKARRIGQEDDNAGIVSSGRQSATDSGEELDNTPIVKRPILPSNKSSVPKKKSSLRLSFGPGETTGAAGDSPSQTTEIFTPKKSNLSRQAIEKNAVRKSLAQSIPSDRLPIRAGDTDDRPSYSKDYLDELKSSTPSTPKDLNSLSSAEEDEDEKQLRELDIAAKFGSSAITRTDSLHDALIPTEAEIREKKARRARLAHEPDFLSLDDDESAHHPRNQEISLLPQKKKSESRLVREDEDIAEGFDDFVEDGRISLGKKAEREQRRRRRTEMADMINNAEGDSSDASDDSEIERNAAYEAAQTRAGTYASSLEDRQGSKARRAQTPPRITPLPHLTAVVGRLQSALAAMENARMQKVQQLEEVQKEKAEIGQREVEIQRLLKEAGDNYEKLTGEAGLLVGAGKERKIGIGVADRGLESLGNTPVTASTSKSQET
ncbi:MAG: hypothetical protein M1827_004685 [Pycnora praestabilis]|nr:MAG: hypothetical protein M1827_004685 [Pycnora praestabilis]